MLLKPVFPSGKRGGLKFTDEPTGALDSKSSRLLLETIYKLCGYVVVCSFKEQKVEIQKR